MRELLERLVSDALEIASEYDDEGNFRLDAQYVAEIVARNIMYLSLQDIVDALKKS
jgi:hypothetical protein